MRVKNAARRARECGRNLDWAQVLRQEIFGKKGTNLVLIRGACASRVSQKELMLREKTTKRAKTRLYEP